MRNKNIIVTGASRGLGAVIAKHLFSRGANLFLVARDTSKLKILVEELKERSLEGQTVDFFSVDLSQGYSPGLVAAVAGARWDSIFGLVNNAGIIGPIGKAWESDWDRWKDTIGVNLIAPVGLCRECVPWMAAGGGGKIVNLSGGGATTSRPNFSAYAVAKTGIVRFTEILAEEARSLNVQVNCIAPGSLNTDMLKSVLDAGQEAVGETEYTLAEKQSKRGGVDPQLAAELCAFLMSPESDKITGKIISAVWDPWQKFSFHSEDLLDNDVYTLRRVVPEILAEEVVA